SRARGPTGAGRIVPWFLEFLSYVTDLAQWSPRNSVAGPGISENQHPRFGLLRFPCPARALLDGRARIPRRDPSTDSPTIHARAVLPARARRAFRARRRRDPERLVRPDARALHGLQRAVRQALAGRPPREGHHQPVTWRLGEAGARGDRRARSRRGH